MLKIAREGKQCRVELFQVNKMNTLFADLVREQLGALLETPGTEVIFDLEDIRFIDSSGFDVLLDIHTRAREAGCALKLCNVSEDVRELIMLLDLEGTFTLVSCEKTAEKILMVLD